MLPNNEAKEVNVLETNKALQVEYTNWRNETAIRTIIPVSLRWGSTEWHSDEQWLLKVWDVERKDYREYALKDIKKFL